MSRTRSEKIDFVQDLSGFYSGFAYVFLVAFNAVNAANMLSFRKEMRGAGAKVIVAKNTLNRVAAMNNGLEFLPSIQKGQMMTIFCDSPVEVAKLLKSYADKGFSAVACSDKTILYGTEQVKRFAEVPALPVLRSMLLSSISGVHKKSLVVLSGLHGSILRVLTAYSQKQL